MSSIFDQIRQACAEVARDAHFVRIDAQRIDEYAHSLPLDQLNSPHLDAASHFVGHGEDTLAFFVTLDAINFGSGYFPHLRKRPGMSGYFTVAICLKEHFDRLGPFSGDQLVRLSPIDCARTFEQPEPDDAIRELMQLFATALNDLGRYLLDRFDGRFVHLIQAADLSAQRLVQILREMPLFNDVQHYRGREVPFFKRAQLTAADLALAFAGEGLGRFADVDQLTIFADNLVPHVLRIDGILKYDTELAARIDREELIPSGSDEEIELRACAIHAAELIVAALRRSGQAVTAMNVDYLLWNRGQNPSYKRIKPRHRTRTTFY